MKLFIYFVLLHANTGTLHNTNQEAHTYDEIEDMESDYDYAYVEPEQVYVVPTDDLTARHITSKPTDVTSDAAGGCICHTTWCKVVIAIVISVLLTAALSTVIILVLVNKRNAGKEPFIIYVGGSRF